jgi:hypothetical protein
MGQQEAASARVVEPSHARGRGAMAGVKAGAQVAATKAGMGCDGSCTWGQAVALLQVGVFIYVDNTSCTFCGQCLRLFAFTVALAASCRTVV